MISETPSLFMTLSAVIGGLALFMFGMSMMAQGLKSAAGDGLRKLLYQATQTRLRGLGLGTLAGLLVHSSAATVMLVGFVNAGLIDLLRSIPVIMGANIGTTLSMQIISFDLDDYAFFAIGTGFLMQVLGRKNVKHIGKGLMGFGLLFLGLSVMKDSIRPHRDAIQPFLIYVDGSTPEGLWLGIAVATAVTMIIQSSGATIGMVFALVSAGAFTSLHQVYPVILGAHVGTCATALLGSIGANIEARRCAIAHLLFNLVNLLIGVLAMRYFILGLEWMTDDLLRQTANFNTAIRIVTAAVLLPFTPWIEKLIRFLFRSKSQIPSKSFLDEQDLDKPERAISHLIRELQRVAKLCRESLNISAPLMLLEFHPAKVRKVQKNEEAINEIKLAVQDYLHKLSQRKLSRRQVFLLQYLDRCITALERIGDHIESLLEISDRRKNYSGALVDEDSLKQLMDVYQQGLQVIDQVIESFEGSKFTKSGKDILEARDQFLALSEEVKSNFASKQADRVNSPLAGVYYMEYIAALDRMVRHAKIIGLTETLPDFSIKQKKLERVVDLSKTNAAIHPPVNVDDFLKEMNDKDED